ncbi:MAG: tryptophan synthase subunit alpha [Acutalibacteraceae bacterium]|nr:tryptophan synthase subunit alpha [Acutalibacteraceae bacterium]
MSNTAKAFKNGKAFIPFITAGDPNLDVTKEIILAMAEAGADLIEIGIPFSDPVAEGLVIQAADERALKAGTTTDKIFDMVAKVREKTDIPLAFMTYINPIYVYGVEKFCSKCAELKIDALIVPDVPYEEKNEIAPYCKKYGIDVISLIAPTSHDRIRTIASEAEGFIYCVSSMGVTGVRKEIKTNVGEMTSLVKEVTDIPTAIGFGISTPQQAKEMAQYADGVIVGSAIVKICAEYGADCVPYVYNYVKEMKNAIHP